MQTTSSDRIFITLIILIVLSTCANLLYTPVFYVELEPAEAVDMQTDSLFNAEYKVLYTGEVIELK
jgi:hypothetical protein